MSPSVFYDTKYYCVLVRLVSRVFYYSANTLKDEFDKCPTRFRREPISLTLAVILGLGVAAGVGTGTAALIQVPQYFNELRIVMDKDLRLYNNIFPNSKSH